MGGQVVHAANILIFMRFAFFECALLLRLAKLCLSYLWYLLAIQ